MDAQTRRCIRAIVRQVHPDLFQAHPYEHTKNTESLKALNIYADQLSQGLRPEPARVEFYVREAGGGGGLARVAAELPAWGSLGPLFLAFGLITEQELAEGAAALQCSTVQRNQHALTHQVQVVEEAVRAADAHDALKRLIRQLRAGLESRFELAGIAVGGEFAVSAAEQQRQVDALRTLETCLTTLCADDPQRFAGLSFRRGAALQLYHPDSCPLDTLTFIESDGSFNMRTAPLTSHVADDGTLHVVADRGSIQEAVGRLDLGRARLLARLTQFWARRSRGLTTALRELLGMENVWCDTRTEDASQRFVLWAGAVLEMRAEVAAALGGRAFSFSLLVHSDQGSPMLDFLPSSSVLQVRSDCPPALLLDFLRSEAGEAAHAAATALADTRAEEEVLLEEVRSALGARHVIRVCSSYDQEKVAAAARRLIDNAPAIRTAVNLSGASLAIDDCYELWESGFISIPFDFSVSELQPKLQALLATSPPASGAGAGGVSSSNGASPAPAAAGDLVGSGAGGAIGAAPRRRGAAPALVPPPRRRAAAPGGRFAGGLPGRPAAARPACPPAVRVAALC
eukprot:scaffold12.g8131.t1